MFKNMKMRTLLSLGVGAVTLICLIISGFVIGGRVNNITRDSAINNMNTSLAGQAALIELYVSDSESMLKSYASADEIINLLKEPENPEYIEAAQAYTEKFFSRLNSWEGIYLSDWNTKVLADKRKCKDNTGYCKADPAPCGKRFYRVLKGGSCGQGLCGGSFRDKKPCGKFLKGCGRYLCGLRGNEFEYRKYQQLLR